MINIFSKFSLKNGNINHVLEPECCRILCDLSLFLNISSNIEYSLLYSKIVCSKWSILKFYATKIFYCLIVKFSSLGHYWTLCYIVIFK